MFTWVYHGFSKLPDPIQNFPTYLLYQKARFFILLFLSSLIKIVSYNDCFKMKPKLREQRSDKQGAINTLIVSEDVGVRESVFFLIKNGLIRKFFNTKLIETLP